MINVGLEQQQQIRGADGTLLWEGAQVVAASYICISSEAANAMVQGEGVLFDGSTSAIGFIPRQETTAAGATPAADLPGSIVLGMKRTPASAGTAVNFLGVVQEPVKAGGAGRGKVLGVGSLCTVISTATLLALGASVGSSATAGAVALVTKSTAGIVLGQVFKINTAGADGTGSTGWAGILVSPS